MTARLYFVKKARKAYRKEGIKKGQPYFWFRFCTGGMWGPIHRSPTKPRRSALTRSAFQGALWDAEDAVAEALRKFQNCEIDAECLACDLESAAGTVRELGEEAASNRDNMPEALQDSDTGQLLEARAEACARIAEELESAATTVRSYDPADDEVEQLKDGEPMPNETADSLVSEVEGIDWSTE
jgi:hypothetical protein